MKIITGKYRGKNINAPEGKNTRPTTGRIKESIFNIIQFDIEGRDVLDLFAGSGQMGLECISRGANSCCFCDSDKKALAVIKANIENCKAQDQSMVFERDSLIFLKSAKKESFGLIFLDPPYDTDLLEQSLNIISAVDILQLGGIILCETARKYEFSNLPENLKILKEYNYGETKITTITKA